MAAVVLSGATFPIVYTKTGVTTALQAFTLPPSSRQVAVYCSAACWVQFTGADAGSVDATAKFPVAAGGSASWILTAGAGTRPTSVLVAAQSGTADVSVSIEGAS